MSVPPLDSQPPDGVVRVRFWAGARAAAGVDETTVDAGSVGQVVQTVGSRYPALAPLLPLCSLLVDGRRVATDARLAPDCLLEVLPPFAGG